MSLTTQVFGARAGYYRVYGIIENSRQLDTCLAKPHPVVLMFWANWNEPSKVMMAPFWDMAVEKRKHAIFCRLNVDKFKDIVERYQVEALPTFLLIQGNEEKGRVVGAKVGELDTTIKAKI